MKTDLDSQKITVATVYRFITAFKIVPRVRSDKLAHKFVLSKKNILTHPEAWTYFHNFTISITSNQQEMDMLGLFALTDTDNSEQLPQNLTFPDWKKLCGDYSFILQSSRRTSLFYDKESKTFNFFQLKFDQTEFMLKHVRTCYFISHVRFKFFFSFFFFSLLFSVF